MRNEYGRKGWPRHKFKFKFNLDLTFDTAQT